MTFDVADFRRYMESSQNTAHIDGVLAEVRGQMDTSNFLYPLKNLPTLDERTIIYTDTDGNSTLLFNEGSSESEGIEAIFVVQGVLWDFTLPPILAKTDLPRRVQFAKQSVVIHGWGNKHFVEDRQAIEAIHQKMSANYKEGTLKPWDGLNTTDSDMTSKEYSNRYFTPIQHANGELSIPFGSNVDPYQHLSRAATSNMVHLSTNEVGYYQYIPIHRRKTGFVCFNPAQFRAGQLVQIQIAFKTVPSGGKTIQHRLICQLKSIAMLDNAMQQTYESIVRARNEHQKAGRGIAIKRPIGYLQFSPAGEMSTKKVRTEEHIERVDESMAESKEGESGAEGRFRNGSLNIDGLSLNDDIA
ncbi:uncharacterized protein STEHIDRAFT_116800 [Stereum hirsutum FP-91666 SS1]|uniref:Uncharacterized protein n=1 Tax=Stereum hirsutum (strain FP-91666) TaxID=721885 RepID=R7RVJ8_STEHR|nr:uncharacterized protein STEHIDRAFT_116800 [Stereum hirsutum FP-91666 SS1]EIM79096.1 hypothetical protein STEHIDRAFT_116800 [Stereum hirsutum FP-91666 SS1]